MKKTMKRLLSVVLAVAVVATLFVGAAFAATSSSKDVTTSNYNKCPSFTIYTGKGLSYSLGFSKTTITVKNTGNGSFSIFEEVGAGPIYKGDVYAGQSKSFTVKGSNKKVVFKCQKSGGAKPVAQVTVSAGSVS